MYETLVTLFECPGYFSAEMAGDAGIPVADFQREWVSYETDRTTGKITFEEALESVLKDFGTYSDERFRKIVEKRTQFCREAYHHLHPQIIPLLEGLKARGVKIGLISNCYSEESPVIKGSVLFPYFDVACLSFDEGIRKPEPEIFKRCLERLCVNPEDCLYVGDGGSNELAAAKEYGMRPVQAVWYLKDGTRQPAKRMPEFEGAAMPMELLEWIE